jgi:hypothetical protein
MLRKIEDTMAKRHRPTLVQANVDALRRYCTVGFRTQKSLYLSVSTERILIILLKRKPWTH